MVLVSAIFFRRPSKACAWAPVLNRATTKSATARVMKPPLRPILGNPTGSSYRTLVVPLGQSAARGFDSPEGRKQRQVVRDLQYAAGNERSRHCAGGEH